ncbi:MAG: carbohydrate ABC transporter permease [Pleurocapsa minor GSE-CHR-MK-17-07R]|jgi:sn-glycerol 3-phosphate transport system permease protein|nr:carbohydrate ABC transporter permease [Pleurocapsa minor GSE-CHR-MK 17-07R]
MSAATTDISMDAERAATGWRRLVPTRWIAHLALIVSCAIIAFPLFYAVIVATQTNSEVYSYQFTPGTAFSDNWNIVMNLNKIGGYMVNSVLVALAVTTGKVILSLLSGLAFVYFRFPGKWIVFGFVLLTLMMPTEILVIALFRFVSSIGLSNSYGALILPFLASATGTFLFRQHFMNIPAELSEAAQLDGANPWQFLFKVLVPMSWNTIAALAVIQFIYVWNFYLWPALIMQGPERQVIQVGLRTLVAGDTALRFGPMMMGAVIASIPPLIVFLLLQKQFMSGFALARDK